MLVRSMFTLFNLDVLLFQLIYQIRRGLRACDSCELAYPCLDVVVTQKASGCSGDCSCLTSTCFCQVAITVDTSLPRCRKEDGESLSHVCWQQGAAAVVGVCPTTTPNVDFWAPEAAQGAQPFTTYYNVGNEGGIIYFVTKDGRQCNTAAGGIALGSKNIVDASGADTGRDATVFCGPETGFDGGAGELNVVSRSFVHNSFLTTFPPINTVSAFRSIDERQGKLCECGGMPFCCYDPSL